MPRPQARSSLQIPAPVFAIATVAAVLVAFAGSPLPRITPDSAVYLTGAESIAESGEYSGCERSTTEYAPGYPAALAVFVVFGLDAPDAARIVNLLATALLVLAAAALALAAGLGRRAAIVVSLAAAVAPVTLRNGAAAWSEPAFCAILVVLLVAVVNEGQGLGARISARMAVVLGLSWALLLTRYSGLFVVPAIVLAAWLGSADLPRRTLRVAAFAAAVLAVPTLWYARNISVGTGPFGSRSGSAYSFWEILRQAPDGLSSIVLPVDVPLAIRLLALAPLVVAALLALRPYRLAPTVLGVVVAGYVVGVVYAASRTLLDPVDARLLSPVLVPGAVLVALGVTGDHARVGTRLLRALRAWSVATVVCIAVLAPGVAWYLHDADRALALDFSVSCADWPSRYDSLESPSP
jgi:hypothetical protein